jgi:two-component system cell cycle sensor histidine kinase/response regulator CckA
VNKPDEKNEGESLSARPTESTRPDARNGVGEHRASEPDVQQLESLVAELRDERDSLRRALERHQSGPVARASFQESALEEHLRDVQKLAGLGVLSRAIAHDFNNHLTVILGNCSLAQADLDARSPLQQRLNRVREAAQHAAGLTEQLLRYAGATTSSSKSIHLPHLLDGMRHLLAATVGKRCELVVECPATLPLIEADETQLQQVIVNLLTNAAESLERKPGHAWIRLGVARPDRAPLAEAHGGGELADLDPLFIEVADDGSGISPEHRARVFEPFFTTHTPGRGLGLTAVLAIVQSHGGSIQLDSTPGQGTTVRLLWPQISSRNAAPRS